VARQYFVLIGQSRQHNYGAGSGVLAAEVSRVPRRNEEARIYHWHAATGKFPPRRECPDG